MVVESEVSETRAHFYFFFAGGADDCPVNRFFFHRSNLLSIIKMSNLWAPFPSYKGVVEGGKDGYGL